MINEVKICCFCGSERTKLLYRDLYHPYKKEHGPFCFYKCLNCGSGLTLPQPDSKQLSDLYRSFSDGLIPSIRKIRKEHPLTVWYNQCIDRALKPLHESVEKNNNFSWLDVGAGNGELAFLLSQRFPYSDGLAIDFHDQPALIRDLERVKWQMSDLNSDHNPKSIAGTQRFDLVFLITVLEHVMYPQLLLRQLLDKIEAGGCLYLTVPDFGSFASTILKQKWPYFLPGEHLNIPTIKGMQLLLEELCKQKFSHSNYIVKVNSIILPYPIGYYLDYFRMQKFSRMFEKDVIKLPTGILEASVRVN